MNILLTGANGFIGKNLIPLLLEKGHKLTLFDLSQNDYFNTNNIQYVIGNIASGKGFSDIDWNNIDLILHLAAAGVKASNRKLEDCEAVNINGVKNLLQQIEGLTKIPRLVFPRTFYEDFIEESDSLKQNPYFFTKYLATKYVQEWAKSNQRAQIIFPKIFQAYGPGDDSGNVLSYTLKSLMSNAKTKLSSGKAVRDWIYVDDLIDLFSATIEYQQKNQIEYFDFGTGQLTTVREMAEKLVRITNSSNELLSFDPQLDRQDIELISSAETFVPGWKSNYSINKGLTLFFENEKLRQLNTIK